MVPPELVELLKAILLMAGGVISITLIALAFHILKDKNWNRRRPEPEQDG